MLEKIIIASTTYTLLMFAGLLMLPYYLWLAWVRIILLKNEVRRQDLAVSEPVKVGGGDSMK